jgi:hypothetical protein
MSDDPIDHDRVAGIAHAAHRPLMAADHRRGPGEILAPSERETVSSGSTSPEGSPVEPKRRRADYRKTAVVTRRILIGVGRPLQQKDIYARFPADLQDQIEPRKLCRILRASQRAGLIFTADGWWVRKSWLAKSDKEWRRKPCGSSLAKVRRKLDRACDIALDSLRASGTSRGCAPASIGIARRRGDAGGDRSARDSKSARMNLPRSKDLSPISASRSSIAFGCASAT